MREFLLAILAGFVATAVYKTYAEQPSKENASVPGVLGPVIGATTLTKLPIFTGVASEAGHGDAILNANPSIPYTPAFGPNTNQAAREWVSPYSCSVNYQQYA